MSQPDFTPSGSPRPHSPGRTPLRLATRASPLALAQDEEVRQALIICHGLEQNDVSLLPIETSGDTIVDRPMRDFGGKGLFVKEVEQALINGEADMAVHSMKDVPAILPSGLVIGACLKRADPSDIFIARAGVDFSGLRKGARLGTSSLRRQALVLKSRPDLEIVPLRGSIETRLKKLSRGEVDATFLATAGLARLHLSPKDARAVDMQLFPPALGQGAIGIEIHATDKKTAQLLSGINDHMTSLALCVERSFLKKLGGSCHTPLGGLAQIENDRLSFSALLLSPDGTMHEEVSGTCEALNMTALNAFGEDMAGQMRASASAALLSAAGLES